MVSLKLACSSWVQSWRQFGRGLETVAGGLTPNGGNLDGLESDSCEAAAATALQGHPTIKRGPTHLLFCYSDCSFHSRLNCEKKFNFWKFILSASSPHRPLGHLVSLHSIRFQKILILVSEDCASTLSKCAICASMNNNHCNQIELIWQQLSKMWIGFDRYFSWSVCYLSFLFCQK